MGLVVHGGTARLLGTPTGRDRVGVMVRARISRQAHGIRRAVCSAAHGGASTLPFGTVIRVVRVDTRQSVRVVVNDRGPFVDGRIVDLSKGAARRIDLLDDGVAPVEVRVVGCRARRGPC